jgi:hypothetical protein
VKQSEKTGKLAAKQKIFGRETNRKNKVVNFALVGSDKFEAIRARKENSCVRAKPM